MTAFVHWSLQLQFYKIKEEIQIHWLITVTNQFYSKTLFKTLFKNKGETNSKQNIWHSIEKRLNISFNRNISRTDHFSINLLQKNIFVQKSEQNLIYLLYIYVFILQNHTYAATFMKEHRFLFEPFIYFDHLFVPLFFLITSK